MTTWFELRADGKCYLPMVYQYSVFDEVEDVVKVGQVSNVDNLSSEGRKKKKGNMDCQNRFLISEKVLLVSLSEPGLQVNQKLKKLYCITRI